MHHKKWEEEYENEKENEMASVQSQHTMFGMVKDHSLI